MVRVVTLLFKDLSYKLSIVKLIPTKNLLQGEIILTERLHGHRQIRILELILTNKLIVN